jgi:hypothetical protein
MPRKGIKRQKNQNTPDHFIKYEFYLIDILKLSHHISIYNMSFHESHDVYFYQNIKLIQITALSLSLSLSLFESFSMTRSPIQ